MVSRGQVLFFLQKKYNFRDNPDKSFTLSVSSFKSETFSQIFLFSPFSRAGLEPLLFRKLRVLAAAPNEAKNWLATFPGLRIEDRPGVSRKFGLGLKPFIKNILY